MKEPVEWCSAAGLLALMRLPGIGPSKALALAGAPDEREQVLNGASWTELFASAEEEVDTAEQQGIHVVASPEEGFPRWLRQIPSAPAVLYVKGNLRSLEGPAIAVVGTREPTAFGVTATTALTLAAAAAGKTIVSGLALGIDGVAHEAALSAGSRTVAVLGSGLDIVSPKAHEGLAERILDGGGALLSEQPLGTKPLPRTLVARNRLQSGLAADLLVGQSGVEGGTMHTVRFAADQGRTIWCPVPHRAHKRSEGLSVLLREPARKLPDLIPAWRNARGLADRLGDRPLARPVTAEEAVSWTSELGGTPVTSGPHEQLRL